MAKYGSFIGAIFCYFIAYIVYQAPIIWILNEVFFLILIILGTYFLCEVLFPNKSDLIVNIAMWVMVIFDYLYFGTGIILYICIILGILTLIGTIEPEKRNICPSCGKENSKNARYCKICGKPL